MNKMKTILLTIGIVIGIVLVLRNWLGRTCVFSDVQAQILVNGKALKNTKITRHWNWNDQRSDEAVTDEKGMVSFPAIYESSISRFLPAEFVVSQTLSVYIDGEIKDFWIGSKRSPELDAEMGGKNIKLVCELTNKEKLIENKTNISKVLTVCEIRKASDII